MNKSIKKISKRQAIDTGMALTLICLLSGVWKGNFLFIKFGIVLLILNMAIPVIFKPTAVLWFGFTHLLGVVISKIVLSVIFFVFVTPVGIIRKLFGKDTLQLRKWKAATMSVFKIRNHTFTANDLIHPY